MTRAEVDAIELARAKAFPDPYYGHPHAESGFLAYALEQLQALVDK
jgi:hypothetical protein